MPNFWRLHGIETQPVVKDSDYVTPTGTATGAVVVLDGTPAVGQVPTFDGTKFTPGTGAAGAMVPTHIPSGETFTVPDNRQALFAMTIDCEGFIDVGENAFLIEI